MMKMCINIWNVSPCCGAADVCPSDHRDYRVAVGVGVTLLVLIVIVVVVYFVSRRRRTGGYQLL